MNCLILLRRPELWTFVMLGTFIGNIVSRLLTRSLEKDASKALKAKAREKLNPSLGKIDIDYQVATQSLIFVIYFVLCFYCGPCGSLLGASRCVLQVANEAEVLDLWRRLL
jgi:hypothetical protein